MTKGLLCLRGQLTDEGVECQGFRDEKKDLYTLVGDLGGFKNGDTVIVCGTPVSVSFCNQGTTLAVSSIQRPHGFKDDELRIRDVEVAVTRSSADHSPILKLEGKAVELRASGATWKGTYAAVSIVGPLQIVFLSEGWPEQVFELEVVVKHPTSPGKDKKETFRKVVSKGEVTFDESMEVA
jgi:hypothetical protein